MGEPYFVVRGAGVEMKSRVLGDSVAYLNDPYFIIIDVPDSSRYLTLEIEAWDDDWPDWLNPDDQYDINEGGLSKTLTFIADVVNGTKITADGSIDGLDEPDGVIEVLVEATNIGPGDLDEDGLLDAWEVYGYDANGDGLVDVDFLALGASPYKKDIFVEVDWMRGSELGDTAKDRLVEAFAYAPVSNPDGTRGINLHIIDDDEIEYRSEVKVYKWPGDLNDFGDYRDRYFTESRRMVFRYGLMVDEIDYPRMDVAGVALGREFMVEGMSSIYMGYVFMHELGHTLGLLPGLFDGIDSRKYAFSDYPSAMNYNAPWDFYGYSSGFAGPNDFDDWGHIRIPFTS